MLRAARRRGGFHLGRGIPPPPRAQHVGVARRLRPPSGTTGLYHVAIRYPDRRTLGDALRAGSSTRSGRSTAPPTMASPRRSTSGPRTETGSSSTATSPKRSGPGPRRVRASRCTTHRWICKRSCPRRADGEGLREGPASAEEAERRRGGSSSAVSTSPKREQRLAVYGSTPDRAGAALHRLAGRGRSGRALCLGRGMGLTVVRATV